MNDFTQVIQAGYRLLNIPIHIMGFDITFLNIIMWSTVASLIIWFIREVK
jgi:hypothetical protein